MSHREEKRARLAAVVDAILRTGTSVPAVVDMLAAIFREGKFSDEAALLEDAAAVMLGAPPDTAQIAAWFDAQADKERELLDSKQLRPDARERVQERWLAYKASAQSVREGAWRKP